MTDDAAVERDALAFARPRYVVAIVLETVLSFAMPCFLLCGGMLYLPIMIIALARGAYGNPLPWMTVATMVLGWSGVAGVARVLWLVCARRPPRLRRALTLLLLACGVADALFVWWAITFQTSGQWAALIGLVYVPLACTAHLVYLARRRLFA